MGVPKLLYQINRHLTFMKMATKAIKIAVDPGCNLAGAEVYSDAKYDYSCSLTYADIGMNSNKFYVMQIIVAQHKYYLYTKYGRTGEKGTAACKHVETLNQVIGLFRSQYRSKTGNVWGDEFKPQPNKYFKLEVENFEEEITVESEEKEELDLETQVINLISLIRNTNIHTKVMRSFGVDTNKMPLGKISAAVIGDANNILYALSEIVNAVADGTWIESKAELGLSDDYVKDIICTLSNEFWTRIPYACGRGKPPLIDAPHQIDRCAELIDVMKNTKIANQIIKKSPNISTIYEGIDADITWCSDPAQRVMIADFVMGTKAKTHQYDLEVLEIFCVNKYVKDPGNLFYSTSNHMLLAHGSRMSNFMGILSTGLRVPASNQVSNGSTLGRGIYFADVISKSFNYCNARDTENIGFVLICEVALGDKYDDQETAIPNGAPDISKEYTCRRGLGQTDVTEYSTCYCDADGVKYTLKIPVGGLKERKGLSYASSFMYNEYVIFNALQYRFRYLVQLKCS